MLASKKVKISDEYENLLMQVHNYQHHHPQIKNKTNKTCVVCMEGEKPQYILKQCQLCLYYIHPSCYGKQGYKFKTDDIAEEVLFFCHRCLVLLAKLCKPKKINCDFCNNLQGIMKRFRCNNKWKWGHIEDI